MTVAQLIDQLRQFDAQAPVFIQLPDGICLDPIAHPMQFCVRNGNVVARPPEFPVPDANPGVLVSPLSPDE